MGNLQPLASKACYGDAMSKNGKAICKFFAVFRAVSQISKAHRLFESEFRVLEWH